MATANSHENARIYALEEGIAFDVTKGTAYYTAIRDPGTFMVHDTTNKRGYVFRPGGITPPGSPSRYYDVATDAWVNYQEPLLSYGNGACGAYDGSRYIYVAFGANRDDFQRYDTQGDSWSTMTDVPVVVGLGGAMFYANSAIYLLPGLDSRAFYRYNIGANTWTQMTDMPSVDRTPGYGDHTINPYSVVIGTVLGGTHIILTTDHHVVRYNASTDTWIGDGSGDDTWIAMRYCIGIGGAMYQDPQTNYVWIIKGCDTGQIGHIVVSNTTGSNPIWYFARPGLLNGCYTEGTRMFIETANGLRTMFIMPGNGSGEMLKVRLRDLKVSTR